LEALPLIDFSRVGFGILSAEVDARMALRNLVESQGYTFVMEQSRSYWFINTSKFRAFTEI
jgi:hypothetical protein